MTNVVMFDRVMNLHMHRKDGSIRDVLTPATGRKPMMRLSGKLLQQNIIQSVELRLTNFFSDVILSDYDMEKIVIEAGYAGEVTVAFELQVLVSYQEVPGPDGVTCFSCLLGRLDLWRGATVGGKYGKGAMLQDVLSDIAGKMSMDLEYDADPGLALKVDVFENGLAHNLFPKLERMFGSYASDGSFTGIRICPYGPKLLCYAADKGTGVVQKMKYISHARHSAAGYEIVAPWIPALRPGDTLQINPKWFRQDYGASVTPGTNYVVYSIDFEFCTTDATNRMTILTVGSS